MAIGDQNDMLSRLQGAMPPWFGDFSQAPIVTAILTGIANGLAFFYSLYAYVELQTRIATATDSNLDIIAADYFGNGLIRFSGQTDASYRYRIQASLFRQRTTRQAIINVCQTVTGRTPLVIENSRPADNAIYDAANGNGYFGVSQYASGAPGSSNWVLVVAYRANPANGSQDSDIYYAINSVRPAGVQVWVALSN